MSGTCARCRQPAEELHWGGLLCSACAGSKHKIYMHYFCRGSEHGPVWVVNFLYPNARDSVCWPKQFRSEETIREMAKRGNALKCLADKQALEEGLSHGRGDLNLELSEEQLRKLRGDSRAR